MKKSEVRTMIREVIQDTMDDIIIWNDKALRSSKWYVWF